MRSFNRRYFGQRRSFFVPALVSVSILGMSSGALAAPGFIDRLFGKKNQPEAKIEQVTQKQNFEKSINQKAEAQAVKSAVILAMKKMVMPVISDDGEVRPRHYFEYMNSIARKVSGKGEVQAHVILDPSTVKPFVEYVLVKMEALKQEAVERNESLSTLQAAKEVAEEINSKTRIDLSEVPNLKFARVSVVTSSVGPGGFLQEVVEGDITTKIFALRNNESVLALDPNGDVVLGGSIVRNLKTRRIEATKQGRAPSDSLFYNATLGEFLEDSPGSSIEVFKKLLGEDKSMDLAKVRATMDSKHSGAVDLFDFSSKVLLEHHEGMMSEINHRVADHQPILVEELTEEEAGIFFCQNIFK